MNHHQEVFTAAVGHNVTLRDDGSDMPTDVRTWGDTFTAGYHLPPAEMAVPFTVLDLGANIGLTAAHYRTLWPFATVVAVEMDEQNAFYARLNAPGVSVLNVAVTADGEGTGLYDDTADASAYRLGRGSRQVETLTLRQIIEREFVEPVDFVKMDVEGTEWDLFDDPDWVPLVRNLLVELHGDGGPDHLVELGVSQLTEIGYRADRHRPHPAAVFASAR